jgi:glycosyltransferase involved in cell wall biosynthesis
MKIKYFFCFKEDKRSSMDMLGNFISNGQKKYKKNFIELIIPKTITPQFFNKYNYIMRFERFISYPIQSIFTKKSDIAHIIDHSYSHLVQFLNAKKKIVTINDLIPLIFEKKLKRSFLLFKYSVSKIKYFDHVIALSNQSKKDLIKFTGMNKDKITVVYPNVENFFNENKIDKIKTLNKFKIPIDKKKIIVFDTSFYKNYKFSLEIFSKLIKQNPNIVLIKIGNSSKIQKEVNFKDKIYNYNYLSRKQMSEIYKISDLLLFPSLYEGFGIPCVEAMKSGLPVVASSNGSLKEILHNKSMFSLNNKKIIIKHILKLFNNKIYLRKEKNISRDQSKNFYNISYHAQVRKVYKDLLNVR